jgi:PIN domain nuclease of toxin-antitoxin system
MNLLLDTHCFLWWDANDTHLPALFHTAISSPENHVYVSAVSVWEIAIKHAAGKLAFQGSAVKAIEEHQFLSLAISVHHAEYAGSLPQLHRDPFDRLLVAQTHLEGLVLVTVDHQILRYQIPHL